MREILFRAQHIKTGEKVNLKGEPVPGVWVYGGILQGTGDFSIIYSTEPEIKKWPVYTDTVGQFTGLADKNGKKIFEGDILDCQDRIAYVKWNEQCGTWDSEFIKYVRSLCSNGIENVNWKYRAEIIGNVYDNPELLEVSS